MKWLGLFIIIIFGCNQRLNNLTEPPNCEELAPIVNTGWKKVEDENSKLRHSCKKGFTRGFSHAINSDSCVLKKDELIKLLGKPDEIVDRAMDYFRLINPELKTDDYYTYWYKCYSDRKVIVRGTIEYAQKNIFVLIDRESEIIKETFETGL